MVTQVMSVLDTNKDGALSVDEFGKGRRYRNTDEATIQKAFDAADSNGDGKVTAEELGGTAGKGRGGKGRKQ